MSTTPYIIIVEVDHVRAAQAFRRGWMDLERLWPQIEAKNAVNAEAVRKQQAKDRAEEAAENAKRKAQLEAYERELKAYDAWTPNFFGGGRPKRPPYPYSIGYLSSRHFQLDYNPDWFLDLHKSILADVTHMTHVAEASVGPYRMTEHQIDEMVAWEDGSRIARIKKSLE